METKTGYIAADNAVAFTDQNCKVEGMMDGLSEENVGDRNMEVIINVETKTRQRGDVFVVGSMRTTYRMK